MKEKTLSAEAMRYIDNAKEILRSKTSIVDGFYDDEKYVKMAAGTAYAGVEQAAKWYLYLRGYRQPLKSKIDIVIGFNKVGATKQRKLYDEAYAILHVDAYYQNSTGVELIKTGLKYAENFIGHLKSLKGNEDPEIIASINGKRR